MNQYQPFQLNGGLECSNKNDEFRKAFELANAGVVIPSLDDLLKKVDTIKSFLNTNDIALREFVKNLLNNPSVDNKPLYNNINSPNYPLSKDILSNNTNDIKSGLLSLVNKDDAFNESKAELRKFVNENIDNLNLSKSFLDTLKNNEEVRKLFEEYSKNMEKKYTVTEMKDFLYKGVNAPNKNINNIVLNSQV